MKPQEILKELGTVYQEKIDSIVYRDGQKPKWVIHPPFKGVNPSLVLGQPPKNTSKTTIKELKKISKITKDLSSGQVDLLLKFDQDPWSIFEDRLLKNGFRQDKIDDLKWKFDEVWANHKNLLKVFKWHWNRPRPDQIAPFYGMEIPVITTDTHHTPAYPSGHVAIAGLMNLIVENVGGSSCCKDLVGMMGWARMAQGVHYSSDNAAGAKMAEYMWKQLNGTMYGIYDGVLWWHSDR